MKNPAYMAITTKFIPCTNFRPSRIKAVCERDAITVPWDHALNVPDNHEKAAMTLAEKLGWTDRKWTGGSLPKSGYVFVASFD